MRKHVELFFKLIVRNLRDSIHEAIGNSLVKTIQKTIKMKLYNSKNQHH